MKQAIWMLAGISCLGIIGCGDPSTALEEPLAQNTKIDPEYFPTIDAGIGKDITAIQNDPSRLAGLIAATSRFRPRSNPFALSAEEIKFDRDQAAEKFATDGGYFGSSFEVHVPTPPEPEILEPQPYRRLSGVIVADAVYGIMEENGRSYIIRPGQQLPDSDWTVASISETEAVLKRTGNKLPREITVRLEVAPPLGGSSSGPNSDGGRGPSSGPPGKAGGPMGAGSSDF